MLLVRKHSGCLSFLRSDNALPFSAANPSGRQNQVLTPFLIFSLLASLGACLGICICICLAVVACNLNSWQSLYFQRMFPFPLSFPFPLPWPFSFPLPFPLESRARCYLMDLSVGFQVGADFAQLIRCHRDAVAAAAAATASAVLINNSK